MAANPQVARFCNEQVRPLADKYLKLYWAAKAAAAAYAAQGIAAQLGADNNVVIDDGSDVDGRGRITVGNAKQVITNLGAFITAVEASSGAILTAMSTVAVNPQ